MDELISRDALKDALAKRVPFAVVTSDDAAFAYGLDAAYVAVQQAPTIDPVKRARWEMNPKKPYREYKCSDCGSLRKYKTKYCAACGARMDGEEEKDE